TGDRDGGRRERGIEPEVGKVPSAVGAEELLVAEGLREEAEPTVEALLVRDHSGDFGLRDRRPMQGRELKRHREVLGSISDPPNGGGRGQTEQQEPDRGEDPVAGSHVSGRNYHAPRR